MRLADSRVLTPTVADRRLAARTFLAAGVWCPLLAFAVVDTHAHAVVACSRSDAGQFARRLELALSRRLSLGCPFEPARVTPVRDQWHLHQSIRYVLSQEKHHGLSSDPGHDGDSLPDLLGWRVVARNLAERLRTLVPRFAPVPPIPLTELEATKVRVELLADAACAALALGRLEGMAPLCCLARHAAVHVATAEGFGRCAVAEALAITRRRVEQMLVEGPADAHLARAVRTQLRFRCALADKASV
jgi:hypothetical protein